ncbi:hypothetical protein D3C81_2265850 [compost metagenome]
MLESDMLFFYKADLTAIKITGTRRAGSRFMVLMLPTPRMLNPEQKISTPPMMEVSVRSSGVMKPANALAAK